MSSHISNERPAPDKVLTDIADYALSYEIESDLAYTTARYCLIDTLGCGLEALEYPACTKLLGPIVPGTVVPNGARVPGTSYQLDPVQAAFNIGAMIRWLDFNDTWLAAEWGHPSDNLGGILATADWLSRTRARRRQTSADHARRIDGHDQGARDSGLHRARKLVQQGRPRSRGAGEGGVDRGGVPAARAHARADHQRALTGVGGRAEPAHLSPRAQHRLAQKLGRGRRHQPRGAAGADGARRRDGLPLGADRKDMGLLRRFVPRAGVQIPAALRLVRDGERALQDQLSGRVSRADGGGSGDEAARAA